MPTTRNRSPSTSDHCILVSKSPKETEHSQALDRTTLLTFNRDRAKSASIMGINPLFSVCFHMHSSCATAERTLSPPHRRQIEQCVDQVPFDAHTLNRRAHVEYETMKEIVPHKMVRPAQIWGFFTLSKKVFQVQELSLSSWMRFQRLQFSPTIIREKNWLTLRIEVRFWWHWDSICFS